MTKATRPAFVVAIGSMLVGVAVLAAGCGGRAAPGTTATQGSSSSASAQARALAFSRCMRTLGVLNFPDPASGGAIPKVALRQLGVGESAYEAAHSSCRQLLPSGGGPTAAALLHSWDDDRTFARCMRSHAVTNWPDPTRYPRHPERPTFDLQAAGIDPSSRELTGAIHDCMPALHGNDPQHLAAGGR